MRHRIKKIPTLSKLNHKFNHHLLHSDKNTYFYKGKLDKAKSILYSPSIPLLGGVALLLVLGLLLSPNLSMNGGDKVYADDWYDAADPTPCAVVDNKVVKDLALTLSGDVSSLSTEAKANEVSYISQGFTVRACGYSNYTLSAQAAPESTGKLQGRDNTTEYIEGVGSEVLPANFATNKWGYAITDNTTAENSTLAYSTLPENGADVAPAYSSTSGTGGKEFKIVFAAKIGNDKPADHYGTEVLLSLVAGAGEVTTMYSLSYDGNDNTGGAVPATESKESSEDTETFTIAGVGDLVKSGYTFAGWAESADATTAQYQPNATITLNKDTPTKTLYAVWDSLSPVNTWSELKYMQQMTSTACSAASGEKTLIDSRDKTTYAVKKLSDGKCWMIQNLDLNLQTGKALNPADSDVTSNWDPEQTTLIKDNLSTSTWPNTNNIVRSYDSGDTTNGNYYSWVAAKAGSTDTTPDTSICPKGWRLPTGGSGGDFKALNNIYPNGTTGTGSKNPGWDSTNKGTWFGGANGTSGGAFFPAGGYVNDGSLLAAGSQGWYWSSTAQSATYAYYLYFVSNGVYPSNYYSRYNGFSVRCVAR